MEDLLKPLQTIVLRSSGTQELGMLSARESRHLTKADQATTSGTDNTLFSRGTTSGRHHNNDITPSEQRLQSPSRKRGSCDPAVFLKQTYLHTAPTESLPDRARDILGSQPDHDHLVAVLTYLRDGTEGRHDFNVRCSSAKASQIVNTLVTVTIPDTWPAERRADQSKQDQHLKTLLLSSLTSVAGIGALVAHIRRMSSSSDAAANSNLLVILVVSLSELLQATGILPTLLRDVITTSKSGTMRSAAWRELSALLGGSKVLGAFSQALSKLSLSDKITLQEYQLTQGEQYSLWLAKEISTAVTRVASQQPESVSMLSQLVKNGLSLGYRGKHRSQNV